MISAKPADSPHRIRAVERESGRPGGDRPERCIRQKPRQPVTTGTRMSASPVATLA